MIIFIDADGCPVVDITIRVAKEFNKECILICDTSHYFERVGAKTITVPKGVDSVDFKLVSMVKTGDIVVTQDYGLAAMCLVRGTIPIDQNGRIYNNENIDGLLFQRDEAKRLRAMRGRYKKIPKRILAQDKAFEKALAELIVSKANC